MRSSPHSDWPGTGTAQRRKNPGYRILRLCRCPVMPVQPHYLRLWPSERSNIVARFGATACTQTERFLGASMRPSVTKCLGLDLLVGHGSVEIFEKLDGPSQVRQ